MTMTLGQAAKTAHKAKGTILNAIKDGRLSAPKDDKGRYKINPAELNRVFPFAVSKTDNDRSEKPQLTTQENHKTSVLEVELNAERKLSERLLAEIEDLKTQRDEWMGQAKQLALPRPSNDTAGQGAKVGLLGRMLGRA